MFLSIAIHLLALYGAIVLAIQVFSWTSAMAMEIRDKEDE